MCSWYTLLYVGKQLFSNKKNKNKFNFGRFKKRKGKSGRKG